jgi:hypothetical protein
VLDGFGHVVARSEAIGRAGTTQVAQWTPALDYRYAVDGQRADFATTYSLEMSPTLSPRGAQVGLSMDVIGR